MIVHRSNRAEVLVEQLGRVVEQPGLSPFDAEILVVQGQGMERWLSMQLADRLGIWANHEVQSLRQFVDELALRVLGAGIDPAFDPESLMWSIANLLVRLESEDGFEAIARYLEGDVHGRRRIQLSYQVANTFYRYMTYREEMLDRWSSGSVVSEKDPDERWQATVWRELEARHGRNHLAARGRDLIAKLAAADIAEGVLPKRISVFGVSSMPRLHLDLLHALARHVEVHVFVLSPTPEYWGDIATPQEARREMRRDPEHTEEALHLDPGHPLLASLGKLGRDLQEMLVDKGDLDDRDRDEHRDPERSDMLADLQRDILEMSVRGRGNSSRLDFDSSDRSIRIHSCHGPMREVEVVCEELVGCFEADPSLEPQDVIVMTPDIKTYAPYIEAVFGVRKHGTEAARRGEGRIPYRIADRWPDPADEVVDAFRRGLDFVQGRVSAHEAVALLGLRCIQRRFGFEPQDLEWIETWIESAGIRWGVDAAHRVSLGQPDTHDNTWWFGLDRLLLGYAVEDSGRSLYQGVRPFGDVEGQRAEVLGCLLDLGDFLFAQREALCGVHSVAHWRDVLVDFLDGLVAVGDDNHEQHRMLRDALAKIARQAHDAGFDRPVDLQSLREQIDRQLEHAGRSTGFLSGGVTFCELVPMRSIPFRVVCLLGMNDETFPRVQHAPGFDLVARSPRRGDRTARDDDRYLFLEALLSARERLLISYVGQSVKDGALLPPSAVVSELIDLVCEAYDIAGVTRSQARKQIRQTLEVHHPLQPFSPKYFGDANPDLAVHSALYCEAATRMVAPRGEAQPFVSDALEPRGDPEPLELEIAELVSFLRNPAKTFLRQRLGIVLREEREDLASREAYRVEGLDHYALGESLVELIEHDVSRGDARALIRADGGLPHGVAGQIAFDELHSEAQYVTQWSEKLGTKNFQDPIAFSLDVGGVRLCGRFANLGDSGQVFSRFTRLAGPSELSAWIWHLAWLALSGGGGSEVPSIPRVTTVVGRPKKKRGDVFAVRFGSHENPRETLAYLVKMYTLGSTAPLPFFRTASRVFAEKFLHTEDRGKALPSAREAYEVDSYSGFGDLMDPYVQLAFRGVDPLDANSVLACGVTFAQLATRVYEPMLKVREEIS